MDKKDTGQAQREWEEISTKKPEPKSLTPEQVKVRRDRERDLEARTLR